MRKATLSPGVIVAMALGAIAGVADAHAHTADVLYFMHRGDVLLSSGWAGTFSDPTLQAGPLQIAALAAVGKLAGLFHISTGLALSVAVQTSLSGALAFITGRVLSDRTRRLRFAAQFGVVDVALATGLIHRSYTDGHPAQVVIPALWIAAALLARRERLAWAALLIGLSAGCETWGLLGLPILLLTGDRERRARALGVAVGVVALLYGPFVLFGSFRMFQYTWPVVAGSPANLILAAGSPYTWWMRAAQGAAALTAGSAAALRLRRTPVAVWTVPLLIVIARLCFEPTLNDWYLIAVEAIALVAAADLFTGRLSSIRRAGKRAAMPGSRLPTA